MGAIMEIAMMEKYLREMRDGSIHSAMAETRRMTVIIAGNTIQRYDPTYSSHSQINE